MQRDIKIKTKKLFKRIVNIFLIAVLLCQFIILPTDSAAPYITASGITAGSASGGLLFSDVFDMRADPETGNAGFSSTTLENGRLWTDKSVSTDRTVIYDIAGKPSDSVEANPDEFLITLSALGQSFTVDTIIEPTDTVFILDVSASMYINKLPTGESRIAALVKALNEFIKTLMNANPNNRVAVVAYGGKSGESKVYPILKLGHYDPEAVPNGEYFYLTSSVRLSLSSYISDSSLINAANRTVNVEGGTSTQRGILAGAKILLGNADKTYTVTQNGQQISVTRKPNIVLMTDGAPTLGWTDYKFEKAISDTDGGFDCGNANNSDMGIDMLTVLTASYMKQMVQNHYYGEEDTAKSVGFYTIGLDVDSTHAPATMNPYGYISPTAVNADQIKQSLSGKVYNMRTLLDRFTAGETITFPALEKGQSSTRTLRTVQNNSGGFVKTCDYTDSYYFANDTGGLSDAFSEITHKIVSRGSYSTKLDEDGSPDFDGYLIFSDVIGEYMEIKEIKGFWYDNIRYNGHIFANDIVNNHGTAFSDFINIMQEHQHDNTGFAITAGEATALLNSNIAAGKTNGGLYYIDENDFSNKIIYYADKSRTYLGSYFNPDGTPAAQPAGADCIVELYNMRGNAVNSVTGENTDLMNIALHVVTVLNAGTFECVFSDGNALTRNLKKGDQVVRLYVPASLIPMRTVTTIFDGGGMETGLFQIAENVPLRFIYSVGLRKDLVLSDIAAGYKTGNKVNNNAYYFYTNQYEDTKNFSMAFFQPHQDNPYYKSGNQKWGEEKSGAEKTANPTDTYDYSFMTQDITQSGETVHIRYLMNNGRMTVPFTEFSVVKEWDKELGSLIKPEYIQLLCNGQPFGEPVELTPAPVVGGNYSASYTWKDLPLYSLTPDNNGETAFMQYAVEEGEWNGSVFTPYDSSAPFIINYYQSRWDTINNVWETAKIVNIFKRTPPPEPIEPGPLPEPVAPQRLLIIDKTFEGLDPFAMVASPTSIEFEIYYKDESQGGSFEPMTPASIYYPQDFTNSRYILDSWVDAEDYKIVEKNHTVPGYTWTLDGNENGNGVTVNINNDGDYELILEGVQNQTAVNIGLINKYEPVNPPAYPTLTLKKEYAGSIGPNDKHDITFILEGWTDDTKTTRIFNDSTHCHYIKASGGNITFPILNNVDGLQHQPILPPGYYTITEYGAEQAVNVGDPYAHVHEVTLTVSGDPDGLNQTDENEAGFWLYDGNNMTVTLLNTYRRMAGLIIEKKIVGLDDLTVMPADVIFTVEGPNGYKQSAAYNMFTDGRYVFTGLFPGTYTVTETGSETIPDYDGPVITSDGSNNNSNKIEIELTYGDIKTVAFTNTYAKKPENTKDTTKPPTSTDFVQPTTRPSKESPTEPTISTTQPVTEPSLTEEYPTDTIITNTQPPITEHETNPSANTTQPPITESDTSSATDPIVNTTRQITEHETNPSANTTRPPITEYDTAPETDPYDPSTKETAESTGNAIQPSTEEVTIDPLKDPVAKVGTEPTTNEEDPPENGVPKTGDRFILLLMLPLFAIFILGIWSIIRHKNLLSAIFTNR